MALTRSEQQTRRCALCALLIVPLVAPWLGWAGFAIMLAPLLAAITLGMLAARWFARDERGAMKLVGVGAFLFVFVCSTIVSLLLWMMTLSLSGM